MEKEQDLFSQAQVAKELDISTTTLRKYSLIVEKMTNEPEYFTRSAQNKRQYSLKNISDLQTFLNVSRTTKLTLDEAAIQVFGDATMSDEPTVSAEGVVDEKLLNVITGLQKTIDQQNQAIVNLQKQVSEVQLQNKVLLKQTDLAEEKEPDPEQIILDLNAKVEPSRPTPNVTIETASAFDDIPEMPNISMTDDETSKSAPVKSDEDIDFNNLVKKDLDAQTQVYHQPHTLKDMQLPKEKKHWWSRK